MTQNDDDGTTRDEPTYYHNEPASTFEAHLFDAEQVAEADGDEGEKSDRPVTSVCSRSTSYGPFHAVESVDDLDGDDETSICSVCADHARADADDEVSEA